MKTPNSSLSQSGCNSTHSRLPVARPIRLIARIAFVWLLLLASVAVSRAASGVWTNDASSIWSATTNWSGGIVADGSGNTADFTLANVNTNFVTLDASHTLGQLLFGATGGTTTNYWKLNATNGSVLTLAGGTQTIAVSNGVTTNIVVVSAPIAGTSGLTVAGGGQLFLGGTNAYTGTTTVNGGILSLSNSLNLAGGAGVTNTDPVIYISFDNLNGGYVYNQGVGGHVYDGVLIGAAGIVPSGTERGNCLYVGPTNKQAGYVFINSGGPTMNAAASSWSVAMWVKASQNGATLMYQGNGGWGGGDTVVYCNSGATETLANSFHLGLVSNSHSWESGTSNIVDNAWHFVVFTSTGGNHTNYVDGTVDPLLDNSFNGATRGNQIWIGGGPNAIGDGNLWGTSGSMIDEFRMYNRALSPSEVTALMAATSGPTDPANALPNNASVNVASGAKLDMNGATALVDGLSGSGIVDNLSSGNGQLILNVTSPVSYGAGVFSNTAGSLSLVKNGASTLTLSGDQTYHGATVVNNGTLNITGNLKPFTTAAGTSIMTVRSGTVNFTGTVLTNFNYNIGTSSNLTGAFYQMSGGLRESAGGSGTAFQLGSGAYGYGYYYLASGASNFCGEFGVAGEGQPSGYGQADIYGTLTNNGWFVVARGAQPQQNNIPSIGVVNMYPGSLVTYAGGGFICNWCSSPSAAEISVINMLGGTVIEAGTLPLNFSINLNTANVAGNLGILNLNGGSFQCGWVNAAANGRVNFNGGTLAASENQTVMLQGQAAATVYSGGGTINNNGFNLTVGQQLVTPTNSGVSISSYTGGTGYIAPPIVQIVNNPSDTTGSGATAIAQINPNTGVVTNVLMTCPGVNYTLTPSFVLIGGNPTTPATITGGLTSVSSGGMIYAGAGTVTLNGGWTYTGPTLVLGGGLSLLSSNVTPSVAGNLTLSNAVLNVTVSPGIALPEGNVVLNGSNAISIAYGTVFANPSVAAISASGTITAAATTNNITVTGFGLKPGTIRLIAHSAGGLSGSDFANFGVILPPGVVGTLVNNSGGLDLTITSAPNQLTWQGINGNNWDLTSVNWTNNANGNPSLYQQYVVGGVVAGDGVTFDDTVSNDVVNFTPRPTNINLTANFTPFPVIVNSTLPYSINGAGQITGVGNFVKNNTSSLTLTTSNSFTGGFAINAGTVIITNDFSLGGSSSVLTLNNGTLQVNGGTTNNARIISMPLASTNFIGVATNVFARFGGLVSGAGGLTKTDKGTLVLAGSNLITGALNVHQGTLMTLGNNILPAAAVIGDTAGVSATLTVGGGTFGALNNASQFTSGLIAGSVAGAAGDIRVTGGTLSVLQQFGLGAGLGGYGAFNMTGGSLLAGSYIVVGFNSDNAVFNQSGGSAIVTTNLMTIAAGGTLSVGVANFSGGTFTSIDSTNGNNTGRGGMFVGETGNGTLNVSGSASILASGQANVTLGRTGAGSSGTVNLLGGTIATPQVSRGAGSGVFNFNGGTLKASAASAAFMSGLSSANVYSNGVTIDDGGFAITISQPLLGVTNGLGIGSISLFNGGSGYIDTPIVTITDGGGYGSNALATATVDPVSGTVTGIVITCPGSGYDPTFSDVQVAFAGGGATVQPTVNTVSFIALGAGGLTKKGSGTVTLTGVNTFTGPITNSAGTLSLNSASTYAGAAVNGGTLSMSTTTILAGPTTVTNGAALTIIQVGSATNNMGNLTFVGGAAVPGATLGLGVSSANNPAVPLVNCGVLTLNGTNTISLAGAVKVGTNALIHYSSPAGLGTITNLILPQGAVGYISNSVASSTVYAVITSTGPGLVWSGTNTLTTASTNLWDIGTTTNWWLGATATSYQQPIIPGDAVTFNDSGSGKVILNTNAGPSSMVISNNSKSYTFGGTGAISGSGGITKLGSGTAILNLTNNTYTGDATIGDGTLQVGTTTALSSAANLNVGPSGTLELNGISQTAGALSGSGVIDDNSSTNATLTVGTAGGSTWNGTIHDQGLGAGISLSKVGNNVLVIGGTNLLNSTANPDCQVTAGIAIITNNGVVNCSGGTEWWVGPVAGNIATNIVDGGTLLVNNWLVVGRGSATANGTLIVNNGLVQKAGGNNIVVGSLGAIGNLIINGGQVLNNADLWLGESPTAVATMHLNGGLVQADVVRGNNNGGLPTATGIAYFNGGTLQATATSSNYLQVVCMLQSGGLVLDDNGFSLTINSVALQDDGGGGFVKKGSGTVYLDVVGANTYTGNTVVSNGVLAGIGSIPGSVVVAPAGKIGAGDAGATVGTFTIGGNLTSQGGASVRVNKTGGIKTNDQVAVTGSISYGGVLNVANITSDLTALSPGDTFQIFNHGGSGNFSSIVGSGAIYSFDPTSGVLTVLSIGPGTFTNKTGITSFTVNGANVVITATNGQAGDAYYLLESTNIALPLGQWKVTATNVLGANGDYTFTGTNVVTPGSGQQFYILSNTNN